MQKRFVPLALLFAALLLLIASIGARITAVPALSFAAEKRVYLTFDDGPSTVVTGRILDTLKEEGVKATFFIVGDRVAGREETLRRIGEEGHTLGIHSQTHIYREIYANDASFLKDVERCSETVERVTGVIPKVYRFPGGGGKNKAHYEELLKKRGYRIVGWNAVCGDEEIKDATSDVLVETALKTAGGKEPVVLLLHDSAHHRPTADALPRIIEAFRKAGYTFCKF